MYWGEFYFALTLAVLVIALVRQNPVAIAAAGLLLAEWVCKNFFHDVGLFGNLSNVITSAALLLIGYGFWYKLKHWILGFMVVVSIGGVLLHSAQSVLSLEPYLYAALANGFYLLKALAVLVACSFNWGRRNDGEEETN